jgi:hypothetical protein
VEVEVEGKWRGRMEREDRKNERENDGRGKRRG